MEDNFKILIADDEPEILSLLEKALKLEGFNNVIKAQNGTDAVSLCKTEAPDAVWDHGFSGSCGSGIRNTSRFLRNRRMGSSGIFNRIILLLPYCSMIPEIGKYISYQFGGVVVGLLEVRAAVYVMLTLVLIPLCRRAFKKHQVS